MLPHVGTTCKFVLTTEFAALNGVYTVVAIMTYEATVTAGVKYADVLYTPAGLSSDAYTTDAPTFKGQDVILVQSPSDTSVTLYFPTPILATLPDPTVSRYDDMYLSLHIGMFKDPGTYSWVKSQIEDILSSVTGQTINGRWMANPNRAQYLTEAEYAEIDAARKTNVKQIAPLTVQIQNQLKLIDQLQAQVDALTQTVIASQAD